MPSVSRSELVSNFEDVFVFSRFARQFLDRPSQ